MMFMSGGPDVDPWLGQYVVVAGISLLATLFVRSYHLSADTKTVCLGVDRRTAVTQTITSEGPGTMDLNSSPQHDHQA